MIGSLDFFLERHLGFDHCHGGVALDSHPAHEIAQLDFRRRGDHDHSVAEGFTTGFIKKRNVCKEKFRRCAVLVRLNSPLPANPRMENVFERPFFGGVLENYRPKSRPIQVPTWGKNASGELLEQGFFDFIKTRQIVRGLVGIEEFRGGQNLPQTLAEGAFAGGNSPGYPNSWHLFRYVACVVFHGKKTRTIFLIAGVAIESGR